VGDANSFCEKILMLAHSASDGFDFRLRKKFYLIIVIVYILSSGKYLESNT